MRLALLALLLAAPASADEFDVALAEWESDMEARAAQVEARCLSSPRLASRTCVDTGAPPSYHADFRFDPDAAFDRAERLYETAQLWKDGRKLGRLLSTSRGWGMVFENFWLAMTDPEEWKRQGRESSGQRMRDAMERARVRYEGLRSKAADKGKGLTEHQRVALAACVSAHALPEYNQAEADAVASGRSDPLDAARLPWQSFATNVASDQRGRGVCRDYAAIARDFLRAMGIGARVVGSTGHAMTEVTPSGGAPYLFEPQHDLLAQDCKLYRYAR